MRLLNTRRITVPFLFLFAVLYLSSNAFAETSTVLDPIKEVQRIEFEFLQKQNEDLKFYINLTLAVIAGAFAILGFLGIKGISDSQKQIEDSKKNIEKLEKKAQEHLGQIENNLGRTKQILKEMEDWNTELITNTDDITSLSQRLDELYKQIIKVNPKMQIVRSKVDQTSARDRMIETLANGPYRWRSIERLASIGGVDVEEAMNILRPLTNEVIFGRGKSGRTIVRLINENG